MQTSRTKNYMFLKNIPVCVLIVWGNVTNIKIPARDINFVHIVRLRKDYRRGIKWESFGKTMSS